MNTITDGCCIIDALCGIDTASPQVGQFSDNFTKIKFEFLIKNGVFQLRFI